MLTQRIFLRGNLTQEAVNACLKLGLNKNLVNESLVEEIKLIENTYAEYDKYDLIREIYDSIDHKRYLNMHLSLLFDIPTYQISKIIHQPKRQMETVGRKKRLTSEQEDAVIRHVQEQQLAGHCITCHQLTDWINSELLNNLNPVSPKFVSNNKKINEKFKLATPQKVEALRIAACNYKNFKKFFSKLENMLNAHSYDPDLVINVDETTCYAEGTERTTKVLYDPDIEVKPQAAISAKEQHITLCCGIAASGNALTPTFIIKNKTVTTEACLKGPSFDYGDYSLAYSTNGWQEAVSRFKKLVLMCLAHLPPMVGVHADSVQKQP